MELQQQLSEVFSSERIQAENERLRLQHQRRIEASNELLRKKELERNQLIKHLNQLDIQLQHDNVTTENTKMIPSTSKKSTTKTSWKIWVFYSFTFVSHVITERQKRAFIADCIKFNGKLIIIFQKTLYFLKNTVMIFIQFVWLENTMSLIYIKFIIRLANQVLLIYLSL